MKRHHILLSAVAAAFAVSAGTSPASAVGEGELPGHYADIAHAFTDLLALQHVSKRSFDDTLSEKAWERLLEGYDEERCYFLREDIQRFEPMRQKLDDAIRAYDLSFISGIDRVYTKRVGECVALATNLLARVAADSGADAGVRMKHEGDYRFRGKNLRWPESPEARLERWKRKLRGEVLDRLAAAELDMEGKGRNVTVAEIARELADEYRERLAALEKPDREGVPQRFLSAVGGAYDPHTDYLNPGRKRIFDAMMSLSMCGIGITIDPRKAGVVIRSVQPNGPAGRDGRLKPGDRIVGVGEDAGRVESVRGLSGEQVLRKVAGKEGTKVVLEVVSSTGDRKPRRIELVRAILKLDDEAAKSRVENVSLDGKSYKLGYLKLPAFYGQMGENEMQFSSEMLPKGSRVVTNGTAVAADKLSGTQKVLPENFSLELPDDADPMEVLKKMGLQDVTLVTNNVTLPDGRKTVKLDVVPAPGWKGKILPGMRSATVDVAMELEKLEKEGVQGLVFDLRGNGGGRLDEAVTVASLFVGRGPVAQVTMFSFVQTMPALKEAEGGGIFRKPLVVLIDRGSASASELVAGLLKDRGRAVVAGDRQTHGKGSMQIVLPMGLDSGEAHVTQGFFYRITGASTQVKGVASDILLPSPFNEIRQMGEDRLPNALPWTSVPPAKHRQDWDMPRHVAELERRSAARRNSNTRYRKHLEYVKLVGEAFNRTSLPLDYATAKEQKRRDRRFKVEQIDRSGSPYGFEPDADVYGKDGLPERGKDAVLDESLNILADLVDLTGGVEMPRRKKKKRGTTMKNAVAKAGGYW